MNNTLNFTNNYQNIDTGGLLNYPLSSGSFFLCPITSPAPQPSGS
jgi:hypothetical protein